MASHTVFIDTSLTDYQSLAASYDASLFEVILLTDPAQGYQQIQAYLDAHSLSTADINVISASGSLPGLFTPRVVFIDPSVADYQQLIVDMPADATIVVLDGNMDGIQQIRDFLAGNTGLVGAIDIVTNLASLDVVSHGSSGEITLGSMVLNSATLADYTEALADIGKHLSADADILLYGCDVAADATGQQFIQELAAATGADVAASTNLTGSAALGANWVLEASTGAIETTALSAPDYAEVLQIKLDLNGDNHQNNGSTNFTKQTPVLLFPAATFDATGNSDINKVDKITVTLSGATATEILSLNGAGAALALSAGISENYDSSSGVLTLAGSDERNVDWQSLLRTIQYNNTSDNPAGGPRSLTVTATNGTSSSDTDTHTINVLAQNAAPSVISAASASVNENTADAVYIATGSDPEGGALTWSIGGTDAALFNINSSTGAVSFKAAPDYEVPKDSGNNNTYDIIVTATDNGGLTADKSVAISINNVNDNPVVGPTDSNNALNTVAENAATGALVDITAFATDADTGATISYVLSNNAGGRFSIDSTSGVVELAGSLDYETAASHTITVVANSSDGSTSSQSFNIAVANVDEVAPTITSGATATTLDENSGAGQTVYTATSTDTVDYVDGTTTYSLKAGPDADKFAIDAAGHVSLKANPDYEAQAGYGFTVVATDKYGNASEQAVTLAINGINEAPETSPVSLSTVENASILIPLIQDYTRDPDAGTNLTLRSAAFVKYAWDDGSLSKLLINPITKQDVSLNSLNCQITLSTDGKSLLIVPAAELDWMTTGQKITATITYLVQDKEGQGGLTATDTITLGIVGSTSDKGKNLTGTSSADILGGSTGEDVLQGGNGNDSLTGGGATDAIYGGNGDDRLYGDDGIDYLYGDSGNDSIDGGASNDIIFGGKGNDLLTGGDGNDHFVFEPQFGNDRVIGFIKGVDTLHFVDLFATAISADTFVSKYVTDTGNDLVITLAGGSITLVGVADATGLAGSVSFVLPS